MPLRELEKLDANIVVLVGEDASIGLSQQEIVSILNDPAIQVQAVQIQGQPMSMPQSITMQVTSLREQILITISGNQFLFSDRSADVPPKTRLLEVARGFTNLVVSKGVKNFRAYGYNFTVAFDSSGETLAAEIIRDRFINMDVLSRRGNINLKGSGLKLYYDMADAACTLTIEPRESKVTSPRFFAQINYHYELSGNQLPATDVLKSDFHGKWNLFVDLLDRLLVQQ